MKKIFFSLLAIAALASCAKTEIAYVEADSEIKLMPATSLATKAHYGVIDGTAYPTTENFDVYGYWSADWNGNGAVVDYLLTKEGGVEFAHKDGTWSGSETQYHWPKDGSLKFAAYSPASENFAHDYATDTYSKVGFSQKSNTAETIDLLFAKTTADYTSMTAAAGVPVVFEHALAWITLEVVAADATAAQAFDIKKVTIEDVYTQADAKIAMADGIQAGEWSNHAAAAPYVVFQGSQAVTETAAAIESIAKGTIVIPQAPTTVTINYDQNQLAGTAALKDQTIVLDLALEGDKVWEPGKHYKYYLIFGLDEILISPVVVDWEDAANTEVPVKPVAEVANATDLEAALNNPDVDHVNMISAINNANKTISVKGNEVTLNMLDNNLIGGGSVIWAFNLNDTDMELNNANISNGGIRLDNGSNLTVNSGKIAGKFTASSRNLFWVDGNSTLTINDGEYSTGRTKTRIIYVTLGSYVYIKGGKFTLTHQNSSTLSDLIYPGATGTVIISGGTFNVDPTNWLADGYVAIKDGGVWTVVPGESGTKAVFVSNATELQKALDAATADVQIIFDGDIEGNVTANQAADADVVIDGAGHKFNGVLTINGKNRYEGAETLTIKNVAFYTEEKTLDIISSNVDKWYAHNVTFEDCTFTAPEGSDVVAMRFRQAYDVVVKNCTMNGGDSLAQNTSCSGQVFENCTVVAGRGINLLTSSVDAKVVNCKITATKDDGYGIRVDAGASSKMTVTGSTVNAYEPVVLRSAKATYEFNLVNSTLNPTGAGEYHIVVLGETPVMNGVSGLNIQK